ncbi:MAG: DinB family protein [Chitinophagales bacterium]|nr:DinB family protein [Chitinophagales bacterium]
MRPTTTEYPPYYEHYISQALGSDVALAFELSQQLMFPLLENITEEKGSHSYASGKWTIKELLQHVLDSERIFAYRALCIARGETLPLPGFDEDLYAANAPTAHRKLSMVVEELSITRQSTKMLFDSFTTEHLAKQGIANGQMVSVNALGFILLGHANHHIHILKERYLTGTIA